jgi:hypothetical protein
VDELQQMSWNEPFSFPKGCPLMRIPASIPSGWYHDLSTRLYDVESDPEQERPIEDEVLEAEMATKLAHALKESDTPAEQFERLGLTVPQTPPAATT